MKADRLRVVIDSNIWISAALSPEGKPARLVELVLDCAIPVFSPETFQELETRIWKPKFDRYLSIELRHRLLHDIDAVSLWVDIPSGIARMMFSRDSDDDKFIQTALAAQAPYLVSGDKDLLSVIPPPGLTIHTPSDALVRIDFKPAPTTYRTMKQAKGRNIHAIRKIP